MSDDDMAARLAADLVAANWLTYSTADALAECLAEFGWRKAADGGPMQQDAETAALDFVRRHHTDTAASVRYGLRAAVSIADTMAMDAIRGASVTEAQEQFAEAAKRVADAIWALRMQIEVTR